MQVLIYEQYLQYASSRESMKKTGKRSDCPISSALELIGDKWSLLIIRDIMIKGKFSYLEFLESREHIATNILADRLNKLESAGILVKRVSPKNKSKFVYSLTKKGADLFPVLKAMVQWGVAHCSSSIPKEAMNALLRDEKILMAKYRGSLSRELESE